MRAAVGVDQLRIYVNLITGPPYTAFEHIVNAEIVPDLLHVDRLPLIGKGGSAGDHEAAGDPREIGRQIVGDAVGEIFLVGIVRQIAKWQHDDRQARRRFEFAGGRLLRARGYSCRSPYGRQSSSGPTPPARGPNGNYGDNSRRANCGS